MKMKTLVIAATVVFWTLVLGTAWLAYIPGVKQLEPVAILQIEPAPETAETPSAESVSAPESTLAAPSPNGTATDLPPGFAVLGPLRRTTE
jgi:hypothetical protein